VNTSESWTANWNWLDLQTPTIELPPSFSLILLHTSLPLTYCLCVCLSFTLHLSQFVCHFRTLFAAEAHPSSGHREKLKDLTAKVAWATLIDFLNRLYVLSKLKKASRWKLPPNTSFSPLPPSSFLFPSLSPLYFVPTLVLFLG